jgi:hypothetical protein
MRRLASILALLAVPALAQIPLTTADNWQSIVQTAAPSSWYAFAAGTYTTTGTWLAVTSGWTRLQGAGRGQSFITSGHATNWGVVYLAGPQSSIDGFTIYGGSTSNYGGGVRGTGGQTVSNCAVVSNSACVGGGTYFVDVHNSTVAHNFAYFYGGSPYPGGGGCVLSASNIARASVVSNNSALFDGGGLAGSVISYSPLVDDCDVVNNSAREGAGVFYVTVTNSRIWRNSATNANVQGGGGAKYAYIYDCTVISNVATKSGGGAYIVKAARNSTFAHNSAGTTGGGGYILSGTNLVVRDNVATTTGGGMMYGLAESSTIERNVANGVGGGGAYATTLRYSVISSNYAAGVGGGGGGITSGSADSCAFIDNRTGTTGNDVHNSTVRNCTILNTNAAVPVVLWSVNPSAVIANTLVVHASQTNILDQNGAAWTNVACNYFTNTVTNGLFLPNDPPYRLPPGSPLIDAGNGDFSLFPLDLYGRARTYLGGVVDIGATEWTDTDLPISDDGAKKKRRFLALLFGKE